MILWRQGCEACFLDADPCPEKYHEIIHDLMRPEVDGIRPEVDGIVEVRVDALDVSDAEEDIGRAISAADDAVDSLQSALYELQKRKTQREKAAKGKAA